MEKMTDRIEALERLARLRDQQILSDTEFEAEKARLLGTPDIRGDDIEPQEPSGRALPTKSLALGGTALALAIGGGMYLARISSSGPNSQLAKAEKAKPSASPSVATSDAPRISALLKFDNASECAPSEDLRVLLDDMRSLEPVVD